MCFKTIFIAIGMLVIGTDAYIVAGLLPELDRLFGQTTSTSGLAISLYAASFAICAPIMSTLLTRFGSRSVLAYSLLAVVLSSLVAATAQSFSFYLFSRVLAGIGAGVFYPMAAATAAQLADGSRQGRQLSAVLVGMSVGSVVGVPFGLLVVSRFGLDVFFIGFSIAGAFLSLLLLATLPDSKMKNIPTIKERFNALLDARIIRIILTTLVVSITSLGLYSYIVPMLKVYGLEGHASVYFLLWGLGGTTGAVLVGQIIDRSKRPHSIIRVIVFLLCTVFVLLALAQGNGLVMAVIFLIWGALGWASQAPQQHALLQVNQNGSAAAIALNSSANYLGLAIGAALGSFVFDMNVSIISILIGAALILATSFIWME